ncbi:MAG: HAMP domain-containing histidine kinase [Chlorobi bacterium]|nr:HAMP domain-containing histidine kinase [Chlorobiota bacterium]
MASLFGKKTHVENSGDNGKLQTLMTQNEELQHQINSLLGRIDSLESQTDELKQIIAELQKKKKFLSESLVKLEKLQKEKDDAISMAMHDIKNPAGTIQNLISLLETYDLNAVEQSEVHKSLIKISTRLVKIVDEIAIAVHRTKVALKVDFSESNLNDIAKSVVDRYKLAAKTKNIEIKTDFSTKLPNVELDEGKIDEVIENLINNAVKFSPNDGEVIVRTKTDEKYVIFEVIDNGPGLSEPEVRKAFDKGSQLSAKPTGGETSTGFGLWIVQRIINEHSGKVFVRSKKGSGSTFSFRIPIRQSKEDN